MDQIRKSLECAENCQGFFITSGQGGGTGAGFGALVLEKLNDNVFENKAKFQISIYPSLRLSSTVVEPYNCVLNLFAMINQADLVVNMDNEAMYDICQNKLDLERPLFNNLNRVIAQVLSCVTAPIRFPSTNLTELNQLQTNLVPYPRLKFPIVRLAPLLSHQRRAHYRLNTKIITKEIFHRSSQTVVCDTARGKYMSISIMYRGPISESDALQTIEDIRQYAADVRFVDWCPTGFKIGMCQESMICPGKSDYANVPISACMIANSTSMSELVARINQKFNLLFRKKAFLYWYVGEGMEEEEFTEAENGTIDIQRDYFEAGFPSV